MDLKNFFCLRCNLSNDNIISAWRPGLKTGMDFRGLVWKRARKLQFLVWNGVRIWKTRGHTPTKNSQNTPASRAPYLLRLDLGILRGFLAADLSDLVGVYRVDRLDRSYGVRLLLTTL